MNKAKKFEAYLRDDLKITKAEFGRLVNESSQNINNWFKRGGIPAMKLPKVARGINRPESEVRPFANMDVLIAPTVNEMALILNGLPEESIKKLNNQQLFDVAINALETLRERVT